MTAFDMQRRPAAFQRQALQEPVLITSNGAPTIVAMSVAAYRDLQTKAAGATSEAPRIGPGAYPPVMHRAEAIERIRKTREQLAALGVAHVALFGSVARDQANDLSDVDVVVDTPDGKALGLTQLAKISDQLEHILGRKVDVISRRGLNNTRRLKQRVAADIIDVY